MKVKLFAEMNILYNTNLWSKSFVVFILIWSDICLRWKPTQWCGVKQWWRWWASQYSKLWFKILSGGIHSNHHHQQHWYHRPPSHKCWLKVFSDFQSWKSGGGKHHQLHRNNQVKERFCKDWKEKEETKETAITILKRKVQIWFHSEEATRHKCPKNNLLCDYGCIRPLLYYADRLRLAIIKSLKKVVYLPFLLLGGNTNTYIQIQIYKSNLQIRIHK